MICIKTWFTLQLEYTDREKTMNIIKILERRDSMEAKAHLSYVEEKESLKKTLKWIEEEKEYLQNYEAILNKEIADIRKTVTHMMDERLIAKQQLHQFTTKDIKKLTVAQSTPYFGRIDFQEERRNEIEKIYIGKHGLHDRQKEVPVVVDWRAPISDIYYSGHSEEVSYRAPYGEINGKMYLKRRYEIRDGQLREIFDEKRSEDRIEDSLKGKGEFLIEALNKSNQGRLKEIVATIQDQQNKVIRSDMIRPLVVQGVAGSGKTTIALHRMAYLMYNNRRNIADANYMVIAPNRLFLNYISEILPDLGVDEVVQTTFEDWALKLIKKKIKITQSIDQLNILMDSQNEERRVVANLAKMKGSILLKKVIDNNLKMLEKNLLPKEDLSMEEVSVLEYEKLQEIFMTSNLHLSFNERIAKLREYLKIRLKNEIHSIEEKIDSIYKKKIDDLKNGVGDIDSIRPQIIQLYEERDEKVKQIKKNISSSVNEYISKIEKLDIFNFYLSVFEDEELSLAFKTRMTPELFNEIVNKCKGELNNKIYSNEDLAPLAYIHIKLFGLENKNKYTHIVVDEAQDFDEFKISILREISLNDSFTFVGDLSQGIYSYKGINSWSNVMKKVFQERSYDYHILTTSYRSTVEIVNLANEIIKKCDNLEKILAEPIFRHGDKPSLIRCLNKEEMVNKVVDRIKALKSKNSSSIGIICKDLKTTKIAYDMIKEKLPEVYLLTDETTDFKDGVVLMPSYLSKGLEFDGVILWDVSEESYNTNSIDIKLLYIGITRGLHTVDIFYENNPSKIFNGLEKFVYTV